eukprot:gene9300-11016_t
MRVYGQNGAADGAAANAECSVTDEAVATLTDGCTVLLSSVHTAGSEAMSVSVTDSAFTTQVPLRVWFPQDVSIEAADAVLNAVAGVRDAGSCAGPQYQQTELVAAAGWGGTGLTGMVSYTDVTCLVSFESSNTSAVIIDGTVAHGVAPGTSTMSLAGEAGASVRAGSMSPGLVVSEEEVTVMLLSAELVNSAAFISGVPSEVALGDPGASFEAEATFDRVLRAEGAEGLIHVYAVFSDGNSQEVTQAEGVDVAVRDQYSASLVVTTETTGSATFLAAVPVGASDFSSADALVARWVDTCPGGGDIATGSGRADVVLPRPSSVSAYVTQPRITSAGDPAAEAPISVSTSSTLQVTLAYEDGTSRDFSTDARTAYQLLSGEHLVEVVSPNVAQVIHGASGFGPVSIQVSFPEYADNLTAVVSLDVVGLDHLDAITHPYPPFAGSDTLNETTLSIVQCSAVYQRAVIAVTAVLTDHTAWDITAHSDYTVAPSTGMRLDVEGVVSATHVGVYSVVAGYAGATSPSLMLAVDDSSLAAVSVAFTTTWDGGTTFSATRNTARALSATMVFGDGTQLDDIVQGAQSSWLPVEQLASFSSDTQSAISVSETGWASLLANHHRALTLSVNATCTAGLLSAHELPSDMDVVYANLLPVANDVDLGNEYGPQFVAGETGDFEVDVRLQTGSSGATLNLYDIMLEFDAADLRATACAVGADWAPYSFTCTINDPPDAVLLTGTEISTLLSGQVTLATITFASQRAFDTASVVGSVRGLQTSAFNASIADGTSYPIIAGQGAVAGKLASSSRRSLLLQETLPTVARSGLEGLLARQRRWHTNAQQWARRALQGGATQTEVLGDVDGNGVFDTFDVQAAKKWVAAIGGFTDPTGLPEFQRQQLDPTLDFLSSPSTTTNCPPGWVHGTPCPSSKDVQFLSYVYAKYYRFVQLSSMEDVAQAVRPPATPQGVLSVAVLVYGSDGLLVRDATEIKYEIETASAANRRMQVEYGENAAEMGAGVVVSASRGDDGRYVMNSTGDPANDHRFEEEAGVGLGILVYTYDSDGQGGDERIFAFQGSSLQSKGTFLAFTEFDFPAA